MTDPTFQKSGIMTTFTRFLVPSNLINYAQVTSFPHDAPPPAWTEGDQWTALYPHGASMPANYLDHSAIPFITINDRSNQSIPENKGYSFLAYAGGLVANSSAYFELHGVAGGSTCVPGFGLYNLVSNPKAWTIIKPQTFDGIFSVSWLNPSYIVPVTATVQYAPAQESFNTSRLMFGWDYVSQYIPPNPMPEQTDHNATSELLGASGDYIIETLPPGEEPNFNTINSK